MQSGVYLFILGATLVLFQNCSQSSSPESSDATSLTDEINNSILVDAQPAPDDTPGATQSELDKNIYDSNSQFYTTTFNNLEAFLQVDMNYCYDNQNIVSTCITRSFGFIARPQFYDRSTAADNQHLRGFNDAAVKPWDVMENSTGTGSLFFNSAGRGLEIDMNRNFPVKFLVAGADNSIEFKVSFNPEFVVNVEWQMYSLNCLGSSDFTEANEAGTAGLDGNGLVYESLLDPYNNDDKCFRITHIGAYKDSDNNYKLVIKSPPVGFQGVLWYRLILSDEYAAGVGFNAYSSIKDEIVYVYSQ